MVRTKIGGKIVKNRKTLKVEDLNKPLVIKEKKHPVVSCDRARLANIVESLAGMAMKALKSDSLSNERYATHAVLINSLEYHDLTAPELKGRLFEKEEIKLTLPYSATSWNDLDESDIQLQILKAVVHKSQNHKWFRVRMCFNQFINARTKTLIDQMDEEDDVNQSFSAKPAHHDPAPKKIDDNDDDDCQIICEISRQS